MESGILLESQLHFSKTANEAITFICGYYRTSMSVLGYKKACFRTVDICSTCVLPHNKRNLVNMHVFRAAQVN